MSSDSDLSDEDFVPGEAEVLSEENSADDETEQQYNNEVKKKASKRKHDANTKTGKKRVKTRNGHSASPEERGVPEEADAVSINPEEEKKKEEDLWAKFLDTAPSKPKVENKEAVKKDTSQNSEAEKKSDVGNTKSSNSSSKSVSSSEKQIFEFAGEEIMVQNNTVSQSSTSSGSCSVTSTTAPVLKTRPAGGLQSLLSKIGKKNKLSTLEKSKLDWNTFKQQEGINEELQTHNKGKDGYLERQDFLERADHRQFEIEKSLRTTKRSNR